jgi:hypothetical protein
MIKCLKRPIWATLFTALFLGCAPGQADIRPPRHLPDGSEDCGRPTAWGQVIGGVLLSAGIALGGRWAWNRAQTHRQQ